MKNILVLNYEFPPLGGGASPISYQISKTYVEKGYDVTVLTMGFKSLPQFEVVDGIKVYRVKCLRLKKSICSPFEQFTYIVSALFFLFRHLRKNKYDVNHTHFAIPSGIISLLVKKIYKLPYIITSHGSDIPGYNPDRFKFLHKFTRPLLKLIINNAGAAFAGSFYLANLANDKLNTKVKYEVIREGHDYHLYPKIKKEKIILFTGRLLQRKGAQYLIEAFKNENIAYQIHILGDGPMLGQLKEMSKNSKTPVVFHGWLDNKSREYLDLLNKAEIYILPSEKENASVSLLEAMSAYCAVITTNVSGCPETVGDSGLVVKPRDPEAIRNAFNIISQKPDYYGNLARQRIEKYYSWDLASSQYLYQLKLISKI